MDGLRIDFGRRLPDHSYFGLLMRLRHRSNLSIQVGLRGSKTGKSEPHYRSHPVQSFPSFHFRAVAPSSSDMFLMDLIHDFAIELTRALLVEGLFQHVQKHVKLRAERRKRQRMIERAVHRLITDRRSRL
jgi:hypothetical protein